MEANSTLDRPRRAAKRGMLAHFFAVVLAFAALFGASTSARAVPTKVSARAGPLARRTAADAGAMNGGARSSVAA